MSRLQETTLHFLRDIRRGREGAAADLFAHVYDELRAPARAVLRGHKPGQTLEPTALVHEAYLRLVDQSRAEWSDRAHFVAVAVKAMRQILVDCFRRRQTAKRGGGWQQVTLADVEGAAPLSLDLLALEEALGKLEGLDPRQAEIVALRFYGGLTVEEVAESLSVSKTTVEGEWRAARAWLSRELRLRD